MDAPELRPDELRDLTSRVVAGAERLDVRARRRRHVITAAIAVALIAGVSGTAFGLPLMLDTPVAAPGPTMTSATPTPTRTSTPTPTPSPEPPAFARDRVADDELPAEVTGDAIDRDTSRLIGSDDSMRYFVTRGTSPDSPYCLVLVSLPNAPEWVAGCGGLLGTRIFGAPVGEAHLGNPGTAPDGWVAIDEWVSMNPAAVPTPPPAAQPSQPPAAPEEVPYTVADVQAALDAIGPDVARNDTQEIDTANRTRQRNTELLATEAAARLGRPVALIRPQYVGFPDEATGSMNSLLWWVITSEPTGIPNSHTHMVDGMEWGGWGQGDRDRAALQARISAYLAQQYPDRQWLVVTQTG